MLRTSRAVHGWKLRRPGTERKEKREAAYQAKLLSYSDVLKPGMTRKNVEDFLRGKDVAFGQLCC